MLRHSDNAQVVTPLEKNIFIRLSVLLLFARSQFIVKCRFGLFINYSKTTTYYMYYYPDV